MPARKPLNYISLELAGKWLAVPAIMVIALTSCIEWGFRGAEYTGIEGKRQIWKQLAFARDAEAQYKLGKLYCCGERPYRDTVKALYWWCQAANVGQRDAMLEIGKLYENAHKQKGNIIPRDDVLAYTYYQLAVEEGNEDAKRYRNKIKTRLTDRQIDKSRHQLAKWPAIPCEVDR